MTVHQAPPSLGFPRQEHWSGLPFPSPMHESEKWKWSRSVMSDSLWPHGLQPTRLLHPWDFPGKSVEWGAIAFSNIQVRKKIKDFHIQWCLRKGQVQILLRIHLSLCKWHHPREWWRSEPPGPSQPTPCKAVPLCELFSLLCFEAEFGACCCKGWSPMSQKAHNITQVREKALEWNNVGRLCKSYFQSWK